MEPRDEKRKVKVVYDVFITDPLRLEPQVFEYWLHGFTVQEAAKRRAASFSSAAAEQLAFLFRDTQDQFRNFYILKTHLENPSHLKKQLLFQLPPGIEAIVINKYYEFDDVVARALCGKKLKEGLRKVLDEEADKLRLSIFSVRRQFDNLRRVYKGVTKTSGNLVEVIQTKFHLDQELASRYAQFIFLSYHRFETTKKGVSKMPYRDIADTASLLMKHWAATSPDPAERDPHPVGLSLDKHFMDSLRDIKALLLTDKSTLDRYKTAMMRSEEIAALDAQKIKSFEGRFGSLLKVLLGIGAALSSNKEFKDIFVHVAEEAGELFDKMDMREKDLTIFFSALGSSFKTIAPSLSAKRHERYARNWQRFTDVIRALSVVMATNKVWS